MNSIITAAQDQPDQVPQHSREQIAAGGLPVQQQLTAIAAQRRRVPRQQVEHPHEQECVVRFSASHSGTV